MTDSGTLTAALHDMADSDRPLGHGAWLVLIQNADTAFWAEAWDNLAATDRDRLIDRLHGDSDPLAGALLILLADHAEILRNAQDRESLLADARDRATQMVDRLRELAERHAEKSQAGSAAALAVLTQIAELRAEELDRRKALQENPQVDERHRLEGEVARLTALERALATYDADARHAEVARLDAEVQRLKDERAELESTVLKAMEDKAVAQQDLESFRQQHAATAEEQAQLRLEIERIRAEWNQVQPRVDDLRTSVVLGQSRLAALQADATQLKSQVDAGIRQVQQAQWALNEAWQSAVRRFKNEAERQEGLLTGDRRRIEDARRAFDQALMALASPPPSAVAPPSSTPVKSNQIWSK